MKQTIIIHGAPYKDEFYKPEKPTPSNGNWLPWLQKQLAMRDVLCQSLEFPRPYDPIYADWVSVFEQMKIDEETTLIGHSCGGGFLLRYLSENKNLKPGKVVLVAPWIDPKHELSTPFFDFTIDSKISDRIDFHIFLSLDDFEGCLESFEIIKKALPLAHYHEYTDRGHFDTQEIPEVLELIS